MPQILAKLKGRYDKMSEPARASLWYVFCNVLNKGISLLSTPIFTRIMTESQFGTFSVFQSWYNILLIFTSLNIFLGGYQKGLITWKDKVNQFSSSCLALILTITFGWLVVYLIMPGFWQSVLDLPPVLMLPMFALLFTMPALDMWANRQRFYYKYKKYVAVSIAMNTACMVFGIWAVMSFPDVGAEARVYTDVFSKMLFCVPILALIFWKGRTFYDKTWWKYSMHFNLPLIPHYLSNYVLNQSDRIMIAKLVSEAAAALYYVAYQISMMMSLITTAINNSLTPYIYHNLEHENVESIDKSTRPLVWLVALLCIAAMLFAPEIITIFAKSSYRAAIYVVPPVASSVYFVFLYNLYSNVEYYYEKTRLITAATMFAAALNLILNWIFIPIFSFYAAGYTTLVSYMVLAYMHYRFYKKVLKECLPNVKEVFDLKNILICSAAVVAATALIAMTYPFNWLRYSLIVICLIVLVIKRKQVIELVKNIMPKKG